MPCDRKKAGLITEHDQCDPCQVTEKAGLGEHDQCDPCQVTEKAGFGLCQHVNMINVIHAR